MNETQPLQKQDANKINSTLEAILKELREMKQLLTNQAAYQYGWPIAAQWTCPKCGVVCPCHAHEPLFNPVGVNNNSGANHL